MLTANWPFVFSINENELCVRECVQESKTVCDVTTLPIAHATPLYGGHQFWHMESRGRLSQ